MDKTPGISEAEMDVLKALWGGGPGTVREVGMRLRPAKRRWAYTTVQTLLNRLVAKGYAAYETGDPAHVYRATVSKDKLVHRRLRELADELFNGAASPLLVALVRGRRFSKDELADFRQLVDEAIQENTARKK